MRRFMRTHPWRLEIAPAVAFLVAVGHVAYYQYSGLSSLVARLANNGEGPDPLSLLFTWKIVFMALLWSMEIGVNEKWVCNERRKRFNWIGLNFQLGILMSAALVIFLIRFLDYGLAHVVHRDLEGTAVIVLVTVGLATTVVLEMTRPYVAKSQTPEPPPELDHTGSSKPLNYVEHETDWWTVGPAIGLVALSAVPSFYGVGQYLILFGLGGGAFLAWFGRRTLILTGETIRFSLGSIRRRIALSDVVSWQSTYHEAWSRCPSGIDRKKWHVFSASGPCLEITTKQGHIYRFGMIRPGYVCRVIESVIGAGEGGDLALSPDDP
jgi:hypothetical protein